MNEHINLMDDLIVVVRVVTPVLLAAGVWLVNRIFHRLDKIESQIGEIFHDCGIRSGGLAERIARLEGLYHRYKNGDNKR